MTRSGKVFTSGVAFVLLAFAGVTIAVLDLERREQDAREAAHEERVVGQALLRMDLALAPLLAGEAARWPPGMAAPAALPGVAVPFFILHVPVGAGGSAAGMPLSALEASTPSPPLEFGLPVQTLDPSGIEGRTQFVGNINQNAINPQILGQGADRPAVAGAFTGTFVGGAGEEVRLFFARRVRNDPTCRMQVIRADWARLERWLLDQVTDLVPAARLRPARAAELDRRLASVPAVLEPGPIAAADSAGGSPRWLLAAMWAVVLVALGSVGFALRAANELGERRRLFVSSVTHELRTPLTTFRMYAQMLADGMVPADARGEYLRTLQSESDRLTRIVESVLLYARLEEGRGGAHRETLAIAELMERVVPDLRRRCEDASRELAVESAGAASVHVDPNAVAQVLLNLVDNACKYSRDGPIRVRADVTGGELRIAVSDRGHGIAREDAAAIFRPFRRGGADATGTSPGLGLGLAIARGLANAMGGGLALADTSAAGTTFVLRLPLVGS